MEIHFVNSDDIQDLQKFKGYEHTTPFKHGDFMGYQYKIDHIVGNINSRIAVNEKIPFTGPTEVMKTIRESPNSIFPFSVTSVNGFENIKLGETYNLHNNSLKGFYMPPGNNPVRVIEVTPNSFTFEALPGHFDPPGTTITFNSVTDENGYVHFQQIANVITSNPDFQFVIAPFAADFTWGLQAQSIINELTYHNVFNEETYLSFFPDTNFDQPVPDNGEFGSVITSLPGLDSGLSGNFHFDDQSGQSSDTIENFNETKGGDNQIPEGANNTPANVSDFHFDFDQYTMVNYAPPEGPQPDYSELVDEVLGPSPNIGLPNGTEVHVEPEDNYVQDHSSIDNASTPGGQAGSGHESLNTPDSPNISFPSETGHIDPDNNYVEDHSSIDNSSPDGHAHAQSGGGNHENSHTQGDPNLSLPGGGAIHVEPHEHSSTDNISTSEGHVHSGGGHHENSHTQSDPNMSLPGGGVTHVEPHEHSSTDSASAPDDHGHGQSEVGNVNDISTPAEANMSSQGGGAVHVEPDASHAPQVSHDASVHDGDGHG